MFPLPRLFTLPGGVKQDLGCSSNSLAWLPIYDSSRTPGGVRLGFAIPWSFRALGLERGPRRGEARRAAFLAKDVPNPILKARKYQAALEGGTRSYREVAKQFGVTRQEVCQYLTLLRLPQDLVRRIEQETRPETLRPMSYRRLLAQARGVR